ncbi:hypothetical protein CsSME_00032295 [Camellia sinensis var. sinensis]
MGSGSGTGSFLKVVANNFDVLVGPVVSLVYPLYASIRAIETKSPEDNRQWLTYWILYSMITLFELTFAKLIEWIPFWSYTKLLVTCWLVIPYVSGAAYVYEHYVRPFFLNPQQTVNVWYVPRKKDIFRVSFRWRPWFARVLSRHDDIAKGTPTLGVGTPENSVTPLVNVNHEDDESKDDFGQLAHRSSRDTLYERSLYGWKGSWE